MTDTSTRGTRPDLAHAEAELRARGGSRLRPLGAPPTITLGWGGAVFGGGITRIEQSGEARVLRPAPPLWLWPAPLGAAWAIIVIVLALAVDGPWWLVLALVGLVTLFFGAAALAATLKMVQRRRRRLLVDARNRTLEELDGPRVALRVPGAMVRSVRVQGFENGDRERSWDVLAHVGFAELWIHQDSSEQASQDLAREIGEALGVPIDPSVQEWR